MFCCSVIFYSVFGDELFLFLLGPFGRFCWVILIGSTFVAYYLFRIFTPRDISLWFLFGWWQIWLRIDICDDVGVVYDFCLSVVILLLVFSISVRFCRLLLSVVFVFGIENIFRSLCTLEFVGLIFIACMFNRFLVDVVCIWCGFYLVFFSLVWICLRIGRAFIIIFSFLEWRKSNPWHWRVFWWYPLNFIRNTPWCIFLRWLYGVLEIIMIVLDFVCISYLYILFVSIIYCLIYCIPCAIIGVWSSSE